VEDLIKNALIKAANLGCLDIHNLDKTLEFMKHAVELEVRKAENNLRDKISKDINRVIIDGYPSTDTPLYMI